MSRVLVIGAGLGGLAAAIRLARRGHAVTVLEKNTAPGGKMNVWRDRGYTFDTGPTLLTMPFVLDELFTDCGRRREKILDLVPLDPICRYRFSDGATFDASSDIAGTEAAISRLSQADGRAFRRFLDHGSRVYDAAAAPFLFTPFASTGIRGFVRALRFLPSLLRIDAFRTYNTAVTSYFSDPRIRQLFNRFPTYNGSSPYRAPATLTLIPYVEFALGGWYIRGGMYGLVEALVALARDMGVSLLTGREVSVIEVSGGRATGARTADGDVFTADAVVCNADALYALRTLLAPEAVRHAGRYRRAEVSLAPFVLLLGLRKRFPSLAHHNVFFSADYQEEFRTLFEDQRPAADPTVYVSLSAHTDTSHAPDGGSNLFVLVNAPPAGDAFRWEEEAGGYRDLVLRTLAAHGLDGIEESLETERCITPLEFIRLFNAHRGAIYGPSSNSRTAAFLRPPNRWPGVRGLYFAGGSAHPGGGIPLVLLSGSIAAGLVHEDLS